MLFLRSRRTVPPVGVYMGPDDVRLVQVCDDHQLITPVVTACERLPLPVGEATDPLARVGAAAALVRQALRSGRFAGGGGVVTHLPLEFLYMRTFRAAEAAVGADAEVRRHALEGAPFGPGETAQVCVASVGTVRQGRELRTEFLALSARDADVRAFLERFGDGLTVRSLRAEPFAIYAAGARSGSQDQVHAIVHVGSTLSLVLIGSGEHLSVIRRVDVGGQQLDRAVARRLGVSQQEARRLRARPAAQAEPVRGVVADAVRPLAEELAGEAAACVRYHGVTFRAPAPGCVRLLGPEASDPHLRTMLGAATGAPVEGLGAVEGLSDDEGGWAAALGLAMAPAGPWSAGEVARAA